MKLAEYIRQDAVVVPLESGTLNGAAWELVDRLAAVGGAVDVTKLRRRVEEERAEDLVAMADRAFLLHFRTNAVADLRVALGTAPNRICRTLGDDEAQCARVVAVVAGHPKLASPYLQVVGALARLLSKPTTVDLLLAQATADGVAALPLFHEVEMSAQLSVRDVMNERPRVVGPTALLRDAAREIARARIGGMPVVDDEGRVIGMLGERELIRTMLERNLRGGHPPPPGLAPQTVRDAMTRQVLCVSPEQPIADAVSVMINKDVDRIPVVRDGRLVGLLTRGDIVRKMI